MTTTADELDEIRGKRVMTIDAALDMARAFDRLASYVADLEIELARERSTRKHLEEMWNGALDGQKRLTSTIMKAVVDRYLPKEPAA